MNTVQVELQILNSTGEALVELHTDLLRKRNKMDRWFNRYLDLFSEKITLVAKTDPIKKLYDSKYEEYTQLTHLLRIATVRMDQQ